MVKGYLEGADMTEVMDRQIREFFHFIGKGVLWNKKCSAGSALRRSYEIESRRKTYHV